jgi:hypothetical protein
MPGDGIVPKPPFVITHGITIDAPKDVWPWLVQMGWHRGGWYTARWVDKLLFPANQASVAHIIDQYQDLHVGDFIPDGAPETECGFVVEELEAPAFSFCTPHPICHWNGGAPAKRRLIGRGSWCGATRLWRSHSFHLPLACGNETVVAHLGYLGGNTAGRLRHVERHAAGC